MKSYCFYKIFYILLLLLIPLEIVSQDLDKTTQANPKRIESLILELKNWPLASAKKAAEVLISQKENSRHFLMMSLKNAEPAVREACAYCLGEMKEEDAFPVLLEMALSKEMSQRVSAIFIAMIKIQPEAAYEKILNLFRSPSYDRHNAAYQALSPLTGKKHLSVLEDLFLSKSYKTRKLAIQLASHTKNIQAFDLFIQGLKDDSPYVAYEAMNILSKISSEVLQKKLKEQFPSTNRRFLSYIILTLVLQEDRFEKKILDSDILPFLIRAVRNNNDLFAQGACACALVNMGFVTEDSEIIELMDRHLPAVLIECLSGKVYFRDYLSLREIGYKKLRQLTGKDLGYHIDKWWAWWHTESARFRAVRLLKGLSQEQIKSMVLEYQQQGSIENQKIVFFASAPGKILAPEDTSWVIMNYEQTREVSELLRKIRFFELQPEYGDKQPLAWQSIELKLENLHKRVVIYGKEDGVLEPAIAFLLQILKENSWQSYWDSSKEPDWEKWYESQNTWFSEVKDARLRSGRIKSLILDSYGWLKPAMREKAAEELLDWMKKDSELSLNYIQWILFHIRSEMELNRASELLIQAVSLTKEPTAIAPLCDFLVLHFSNKSRALLLQLMGNADSKLLLQYINHPSPYLRSIACEILGKRKPDELTILYLTALLKDEHLDVRQAAISALGNLKAENAWDSLLNIAQNPQYKIALRQSAIIALPQISREKANSVLLGLLNNSDSGIRQAVAQGLTNIGGTSAIQTLIGILKSDSSPIVKEIVSHCLAEIKPQEEAILALEGILVRSEDIPMKIMVLQSLKRISSYNTRKTFVSCLKDSSLAIRMQAAFALVEHYDKRAIPVLIDLLDHPKDFLEVRKNLEKITLQVFSQEDAASLKGRYQAWWDLNKSLSWEQWLFDALKSSTYNVAPMLDYFLEGEFPQGMIHLLIRVLGDKDRYLRCAACYLLESGTGKSFGKIQLHTSQKACLEIRKSWEEWLKNRK